MLGGAQHFRTRLSDEHRAALRGLENALARECHKRLLQRFRVSPYIAAGLVMQWIQEVEAPKRPPLPPPAKR